MTKLQQIGNIHLTNFLSSSITGQATVPFEMEIMITDMIIEMADMMIPDIIFVITDMIIVITDLKVVITNK